MAHISPTFPNQGDHNWAGTMNASLQSMVDKENALDDAIAALQVVVIDNNDGTAVLSAIAPAVDNNDGTVTFSG